MLHGIGVDWVWRVSEFVVKRKVKKNANANALNVCIISVVVIEG